MVSKTEIFVLVLVTMETLIHQQATDNVAPTRMDLPQAQQMFVQTFLDMDLNHDHLVGLREFMDPFLKHDHDHNMAVSLTEFVQQAPAEENREYLASDFRFHDENHDYVITVPEMQLQFSTIDTDDNMAVSLTEFVQQAPAEENREYLASDSRFHDENHDYVITAPEMQLQFSTIDTDDNMAVSLTEFVQQAPAEENREYLASDSRFHDENHDDVITVPEMQLQFSTIDTDASSISTRGTFDRIKNERNIDAKKTFNKVLVKELMGEQEAVYLSRRHKTDTVADEINKPKSISTRGTFDGIKNERNIDAKKTFNKVSVKELMGEQEAMYLSRRHKTDTVADEINKDRG